MTTRKFDRYMKARQHMTGLEDAPIGFRFTGGRPVDPNLENAILSGIERLRKAHPDIDIRLDW